MDFSLLVARNMHAVAAGVSGASPATISFTVNTTTGGLTLDSFPELTYARGDSARTNRPVSPAI
jgi:hypothetical protein